MAILHTGHMAGLSQVVRRLGHVEVKLIGPLVVPAKNGLEVPGLVCK